jgi:hypothetical protein
VKAILVLLLICGFHNVEEKTKTNSDLKISAISVNYPTKGNWIMVPKTGTLKILVQASNVKEMKFWLVPTGTATWKLRTLIGEDSLGVDGWKLMAGN